MEKENVLREVLNELDTLRAQVQRMQEHSTRQTLQMRQLKADYAAIRKAAERVVSYAATASLMPADMRPRELNVLLTNTLPLADVLSRSEASCDSVNSG